MADLYCSMTCVTFDVGCSIVHSRHPRHSEVSQGIVKAAERLNNLQAMAADGLDKME
jgi:hypothetical protein